MNLNDSFIGEEQTKQETQGRISVSSKTKTRRKSHFSTHNNNIMGIMETKIGIGNTDEETIAGCLFDRDIVTNTVHWLWDVTFSSWTGQLLS